RLSNVVFDSRTAQRRPGQAQVDGFFRWKDSDSYRALQPDPVGVQERLVFVYSGRKDLQKIANPRLELRIDIPLKTTNSKRVGGKPGADEVFEYLQDLFALTEAIEQHGNRSNVHSVSSQPEQMRRDALELAQDDSQVFGSFWNFDLQHLLDALDVTQVIRYRS